MKDTFCAYLAGLFDIGGCIILTFKSQKISITNTDIEILKMFQNNFGGAIYKRKKAQEHHTQSYTWVSLKRADKLNFLWAILPYILITRKRALDFIEFLEKDGACLAEYKKLSTIPTT